MPRVKFVINPQGHPTVLDVEGGKKACRENLERFEADIGRAKEETRVRTDSYYEGEDTLDEQITQQ